MSASATLLPQAADESIAPDSSSSHSPPLASSFSSAHSSLDVLPSTSSSSSPSPSPAPSEADVDADSEAAAIDDALSHSLDNDDSDPPPPPSEDPDADYTPSAPAPSKRRKDRTPAPRPAPVDPSIARATGAKLLDDLLAKAAAYMARTAVGAELAVQSSTTSRASRSKKWGGGAGGGVGGRMSEKEEDDQLLHALEDEAERSSTFIPLTEQPSSITGKMRHYQLEGLNWMIKLYDSGVSGILADEMGLGKTLQSISMLAYLKHVRHVRGPHLVLTPLSTLGNWYREFARWAPSLRVLKFHGTKEERAEMIARGDLRLSEHDILLTSYEMAIREKAVINRHAYEFLIVDEAHRLKNEHSLLSVIVRYFSSRYRLLLTGTPLQNNLHELWALLNFLLPDLFSSAGDFDAIFSDAETDSDSDRGATLLQSLHRLLRPFMLRRLKTQVEQDLPPKKTSLIYTGLSEIQRRLYKQILEKDVEALMGTIKERGRLMNIVMQLRKVADHPFLFAGVEDPNAPLHGDHLVTTCGKMIILDRLLAHLRARGSRVLIFSQMTRMLDILEDYLVWRAYPYCFPASDTRVLTNQGFLFLDEIQERLRWGEPLLYACYDEKSTELQYSEGVLVIPEEQGQRPPSHLVQFTSSGEEVRWGEESGAYGKKKTAEFEDEDEDDDDDDATRSRHVSLRVTPDHRMYVQTGNMQPDGKKVYWHSTVKGRRSEKRVKTVKPYFRVPASDLSTADNRDWLRMLAHAGAGHVPQSTATRTAVMEQLGLTTDAQFVAFIELFGFWLGDGTLDTRQRTVMFGQVKEGDREWLRLMMPKVGLIKSTRRQPKHPSFTWSRAKLSPGYSTSHSGKQEWLSINLPGWFDFFDREFGVKYKHSRYFVDVATALKKQGVHTSASQTVRPVPIVLASCATQSMEEESKGEFVKDEPSDDDVIIISSDEEDEEVDEDGMDVVDLTGEDAPPDDAVPPELLWPIKSVKWLPEWVLVELTPKELQKLVEGLHRADGHFKQGKKCIWTSGVLFRDQLVHAFLHCGYSAHATSTYKAGTVTGYYKGQDILSVKKFAEWDNEEEKLEWKPCRARVDGWAVHWTDMGHLHNHAGQGSCRPCLSRQKGIEDVPYSREKDGPVWCVSIAHKDSLIIAQRAERHNGVVTKQSRPIVVSNCRIDGNTSQQDREEAMRVFNEEDSQKFVFILSTRAGGLGINLVTADTVILYDSDWNPQMDLQAMDRAHRIGQKKQVNVLRLICEDTVEVQMLKRAEIKLHLDAMVIQQGKVQTGGRTTKAGQMTTEDLTKMIRYGADKIFRQTDAAVTDTDIANILERGEQKAKELDSDLKAHVNLMDLTFDGKQVEEASLLPEDPNESTLTPEELEMHRVTVMADALGKRQRKASSYNEDSYFRDVMKVGGRVVKTLMTKPVRLPRMSEHQLFDRKRLEELSEKEVKWYWKHYHSAQPPQLRGLSEEEGNEMQRLLDDGFPDWSFVDFQHFVKACKRYGRAAIDKIVQALQSKGKSREQTVAYHTAFFTRASSAMKGGPALLDKIERAEEHVARFKEMEELLDKVPQQPSHTQASAAAHLPAHRRSVCVGVYSLCLRSPRALPLCRASPCATRV